MSYGYDLTGRPTGVSDTSTAIVTAARVPRATSKTSRTPAQPAAQHELEPGARADDAAVAASATIGYG